MPKQLIKSVIDPVSGETVFCFPPAALQPTQVDLTNAVEACRAFAKQNGKVGLWRPAIITDYSVRATNPRKVLVRCNTPKRYVFTTSKYIMIFGVVQREIIDNFWTKYTYLSGRTTYARGWFTVPKQYVYETPKSLKEILMFRNVEIRRILLERFGIDRLVDEPGITVLDRRFNEIENSWELLLSLGEDRLFLCGCPSTGRRYILFVSNEVSNCKDAQKELWGTLPAAVRIIGRS